MTDYSGKLDMDTTFGDMVGVLDALGLRLVRLARVRGGTFPWVAVVGPTDHTDRLHQAGGGGDSPADAINNAIASWRARS